MDFENIRRVETVKTCDIWTIQMSQWREAKKRNIEFLDITVKTGIQSFAPSWECLRAYKQGLMGEQEYEEKYREKMRSSLRARPEEWARFKSKLNIALACYCPAGAFCHRHIFAKLLSLYLQREGIVAFLRGEIKK